MDTLSAGQRIRRDQASYDIVLIEDDEDTSEVITECIESQTCYRVRSLPSAEAVIQHIQEIKEAAPGLFIIDYQLPGLNGLQLFDHLHSLDAFERVPALILSAAAMSEEVRNAFRDRRLALLPKPFEIASLLDYLECVLPASAQQLL